MNSRFHCQSSKRSFAGKAINPVRVKYEYPQVKPVVKKYHKRINPVGVKCETDGKVS
jgi:hypothetical protein